MEPSNSMLFKTGRQIPCRLGVKNESPAKEVFNPFVTSYNSDFTSPYCHSLKPEDDEQVLSDEFALPFEPTSHVKVALKDCELLDLPMFASARREKFFKIKRGVFREKDERAFKPQRKLQIKSTDKPLSQLVENQFEPTSPPPVRPKTREGSRNASLQNYLSEMGSHQSQPLYREGTTAICIHGDSIPAPPQRTLTSVPHRNRGSHQMKSLLENTFMNHFAIMQRETERIKFLDRKFNQTNNPVFKNYLPNNTSILRESNQCRKLAAMRRDEENENAIYSRIEQEKLARIAAKLR